MRKIIHHDQIIFIARHTEYRGGPQVTVNKIKGMRRMRRRRRKRKSNMTTKLARMAEVLSRSPSTRNIGTTTELSQNVAARVTKTAVPGVGRRRRGKSGRRRRRRKWCSGRRKAKGVKGPVLPHRRSGRREAESFTVRPEESNSMEQELSTVN